MNVLDAFYHLVHDYPGGAPALAPRLGMSVNTLAHKADPSKTSHRPAIDEVVKAEALTGDHRVLFAHAEALGYRCVLSGGLDDIGDEQLILAVSRFCKEAGEALQEIHAALADGRITENEVATFEKQVADIVPAAVALAARMRTVASEQARGRATPRAA